LKGQAILGKDIFVQGLIPCPATSIPGLLHFGHFLRPFFWSCSVFGYFCSIITLPAALFCNPAAQESIKSMQGG